MDKIRIIPRKVVINIKKIVVSIIVLCSLLIINPQTVNAFNEEEILKAAQVAQAFVEEDGYSIDPQSHVACSFDINNIKGENFDEIASTTTIIVFNVVNQGKPSGTVCVQKREDGNFVANSGEYGGSGILTDFDMNTVDEVIILNDIGNNYYCIKDGKEEYVIPGAFRFGDNTAFRSGRTKSTIGEFVNATKYRNRFDPVDGHLMGDRSAQTVFHYIGQMEQLKKKIIIGISISLVLVGTIIFAITWQKRKKLMC